MNRFFKLFKKPTHEIKPLPTFQKIDVDQIPIGAILIFYRNPPEGKLSFLKRMTEIVGTRVHNHNYDRVAYHTAQHIIWGACLNVNKWRQVRDLRKMFTERRRIDVAIYKPFTKIQRERIARDAMLDTSKPKGLISTPDYSWKENAAFLFPFLGDSVKDFCTEDVVIRYLKEDVTTTNHPPNKSAPWHQVEYMIPRQDIWELRTLHIGEDF